MENKIQAKKKSAQLIAATLKILDHAFRILDGDGLHARTQISDIARRACEYGEFPNLACLVSAPIPDSVLLAVEGMEVLEQVLKLLTDPSLDDSATVRALVEYLGGYGFCGCKGLVLPKTGGNIEQKNN